MNLRERILKFPVVYKSLNLLVSPKSLAGDTVRDFLDVPAGATVLDLGCGYGEIARFFADRTRYVGVDSNAEYIEVAKNRYKGTSAEFLVGSVSDPEVLAMGPFDLVFLTGVLHHLTSDEVIGIAHASRNLVAQDGRFVAIEPVFDSGQRLSARLIIASDRGRYVRDTDGYVSLLREGFSDVEARVEHGRLRIPYSHVILTCRNR